MPTKERLITCVECGQRRPKDTVGWASDGTGPLCTACLDEAEEEIGLGMALDDSLPTDWWRES